MTSLLINSAKIAKTSITAHTRNAIILAKLLNITLVSTSEDVKALNRADYDTFIVVGAAFYEKTAEIEAWIRTGQVNKIIWINNEYQVSPNSEYARLIKDYPSLVISNVIESANKVKGYDEFSLVNLNALIYDDTPREIQKKYDLVYYGTYRPGRRIYLQKYFSESEFHISSSAKNVRSIHQLCGVNAKFCNKFNWEHGKETLNLFKYSLYIEDEYTHAHYNHLANRFYEALMCNVVQFFDESCRATLEKSGYPVIDKYFVSSKAELEQKVNDFDFTACLQAQSAHFRSKAKQEKLEVIKCISALLTSN
ncbi:MAG: hypothetical protein DRQ62_09290 [Gammaproteobacteria bacterium]|nr:MAG: hypothetical protein DRQ62_09290 [Gammaproteobacteria bacterium]